MTDKEKKYRAYFRNIGKHLFRDEKGFPINLKTHPVMHRMKGKEVLVNWGWGINFGGVIRVPTDDRTGEPKPYEGFWEARCGGRVI